MMVPKKHEKGFTLIELLMVIITLGVISGLAVPVYVNLIQQSYEHEAYSNLMTIRKAILAYYAKYGSYSGMNISSGSCNLDHCPNKSFCSGAGWYNCQPTADGQKLHFGYTISPAATATSYMLYACRNTVDGGVGLPAGSCIDYVRVNQAGTVTKGGLYL